MKMSILDHCRGAAFTLASTRFPLPPVDTNPSWDWKAGVTSRSIDVGSMFGSGDTWNCGATGDPSNWKR